MDDYYTQCVIQYHHGGSGHARRASKRTYASNKTKMKVKRDNFKQVQSSCDRQVLLNSIIANINWRSVEDEKDDDAIKEE